MIESPCNRHCCLDNNDICIGCFRAITEILAWHAASEEEKSSILDRCLRRQQLHAKRLQNGQPGEVIDKQGK